MREGLGPRLQPLRGGCLGARSGGFALAHQGARNCCFPIALCARSVWIVARSGFLPDRGGRFDLRREAVVVFRRAKQRFRRGTPGRAKLLFCDRIWRPGVLNSRAKLLRWPPPRNGGWLFARGDGSATSADARLLCLRARSGGFALASQGARNCRFPIARGARSVWAVARSFGSGHRRVAAV